MLPPLCNRSPGINLIKFSLGQGAKKELGGSKFIRRHCCSGRYSELFAPPPKELSVSGATKNNTEGIQGKNVDPGFRMSVCMTQLPRLPSPASAEFRNFVVKLQAY